MRRNWVVVVAMIALVLPLSGYAQETKISTPSGSVVVDGDLVRIESGDARVVVAGNWRTSGTVYTAADTDRILADLGAIESEGRIQLNLAGDILFEFNSAKILPDAAAKLESAAHVIRMKSVGEVYVIGHTDSKGTDAYNRKLSQERAVSVMRWLQSHENIPAAILVGAGMGAKKPIAHNTLPDGSDDPAGRARNRRVEIQIATRAGVKVGPGLVEVTPQGVRAGGVEVDAGGVTVGGIRIDTSGRAGEKQTGQPSREQQVDGGKDCAALCKATAGSHSLGTIGCVEGMFEELGYKMDSQACNKLEEAMFTGMGNEKGSLCARCQKEMGFSDADCATVARKCFPERK